MTTPDTAEKIPTVGSAPSQEAAPPQTHHCGFDVHNWSSDGDPGPGENMTLSCVKCGEKTEATPIPKLHTGGVVPSSFELPNLGLIGENFICEHILTVAPHVSLSEAMRAAEDRRSSNLTATMINQAIGMTLVKLGKTEITFSEAEIIDFAAKHRVAMKQNLDFSFTVSVIPRVPE